jgi:hypothetical protein
MRGLYATDPASIPSLSWSEARYSVMGILLAGNAGTIEDDECTGRCTLNAWCLKMDQRCAVLKRSAG